MPGHFLALADPVRKFIGVELDGLSGRIARRSMRLRSTGGRISFGRRTPARASSASLATASLDRVIGRNVDRWLRPSADADAAQRSVASLVRRLQSEAQLVFYGHAVNEAREERGVFEQK